MLASMNLQDIQDVNIINGGTLLPHSYTNQMKCIYLRIFIYMLFFYFHVSCVSSFYRALLFYTDIAHTARKRWCSHPWHVFHPLVFVGPHFVWLKLSQWRLLLVQMCGELVVVLLAENLFPGSKTSANTGWDAWHGRMQPRIFGSPVLHQLWNRPGFQNYQHICIILDMFMWCLRQLWGKGTQFNTSNSITGVSMSFTSTTLTWIVYYMGCLSTS